MFSVAGLSPILHHLTGAGFSAASSRSARRTGSTATRSSGLGRGRNPAGCRSRTGDKMMMIVVVNVMLGGTGSRCSSGLADGLAGDSAPETKSSARRQRTSTS